MGIKNVVIGLPETGKTTFLAALWHVVVSDEVPGSLRLKEFPPERGYIEALTRKWLDLTHVGRTSQSLTEIVMKLTTSDGIVEELIFPDVSGELYREQMLAGRVCSRESHELFKTTSSILLFVNPGRLQRPVRVSETGEIENLPETPKRAPIDELDEKISSAAATSSKTQIPWSTDIIPTQVNMVELLQLVASISGKKLRIALVVSAWDKVAPSCAPSDWLRKELPLLHQLLVSNSSEYRYKVFGVSAFGGDPTKDVEALSRKHTQPSDRIIVQEDTGRPHHDITAPIRWLIFNDDSI